jgi:hypothetical protein
MRVLDKVEGAAGSFFIQEYFFFQLKAIKKKGWGATYIKDFFWKKVA